MTGDRLRSSCVVSHRRLMLTFWPWLILMLVLAGISVAIIGDALVYPDEHEYVTLGKQLFQTGVFAYDGITPTAYRPPGYPLLVGTVFLLFHSIYAVKAFNVLCWVGTGYIVFRAASEWFSVKAGQIAVAMFILYFPELYTANTVYPQSFIALTTMICVYLTLREDRLGIRGATGLTFLFAFQIMAVPNTIVVFIACWAYLVFTKRLSLAAAGLCLSVVGAVFVAWCFRNYLEVGKFTFSTNSGVNLLYGYNDQATASSGVMIDISKEEAATSNMTEIQRDAYYRSVALEWIHADHGRALRLLLGKILNWFSCLNNFKTDNHSSRLPVGYLIGLVYYPALIFAFLFALVARGENRKRAWLCWAIYFATGLSYAVFFSRIRFRLPVDPLLIVLAGGYLSILLKVAWARWHSGTRDAANS
jgi:hypothetical protein